MPDIIIIQQTIEVIIAFIQNQLVMACHQKSKNIVTLNGKQLGK